MKIVTLFQHKLVIKLAQETTKFALTMKSLDQQYGQLHVRRKFPNVLEAPSRPFHAIVFATDSFKVG